MIVRSQDGTSLIQCKNVILEGWNRPGTRTRISEISRRDRDITLGWYSDRTQATKVMNEIEECIKMDNRVLIDADGNIKNISIETVYDMPLDETLCKK
ncbi:MAG: hypothetical protein K0S04_324 [Herbinix sp.]|jgi:hypothetical protein|nr:hypothetical protein [Herbinix sp.]